MKYRILFMSFLFTLAIVVPGIAHDYRQGGIVVEHPWARASAGKMARSGAVYMVLGNEGAEADKLVAVATTAAKHASLHATVMENDVMKMRPVGALEIAPGAPTVLQPGGLHIMLMGLKKPLEEGATFPLALTFEKAGTIEVEVVVQSPAAMMPGHMGNAPDS